MQAGPTTLHRTATSQGDVSQHSHGERAASRLAVTLAINSCSRRCINSCSRRCINPRVCARIGVDTVSDGPRGHEAATYDKVVESRGTRRHSRPAADRVTSDTAIAPPPHPHHHYHFRVPASPSQLHHSLPVHRAAFRHQAARHLQAAEVVAHRVGAPGAAQPHQAVQGGQLSAGVASGGCDIRETSA
jgi:hypothetical protein